MTSETLEGEHQMKVLKSFTFPESQAPKGNRIPAAVLDAAIKAVKAIRPRRVFENYTQADWDQVRTLLPQEWRWLSNDQLKHQACNRRKQAAYSTEAKKNMATVWTHVKKGVRDYWSGNASLEELAELLKNLRPAE
jgi:hypothetical protein